MTLLLIGVTLPAISLLFSLIVGSVEGLISVLKFDVGHFGGHHDTHYDVSGDSWYVGFLTAAIPMSPIVWCVQLCVMGGVGETLLRMGRVNIVAVWVIAVISGYTMMMIVHNCVMLPLKRVKNFAGTTDEMIGMPAEVTETILENGVGAVRVPSKTGTAIFAAKSVENIRIEQGQKVVIAEITDGRAFVKTIGRE